MDYTFSYREHHLSNWLFAISCECLNEGKILDTIILNSTNSSMKLYCFDDKCGYFSNEGTLWCIWSKWNLENFQYHLIGT